MKAAAANHAFNRSFNNFSLTVLGTIAALLYLGNAFTTVIHNILPYDLRITFRPLKNHP